MAYESRPYRDPSDIDLLKCVLVEGRRVSRHGEYAHVGDLDWALFYDPDNKVREETIRLWSDEHGRTVAWGRLQGSGYFEHYLLPALRGAALEDEIVNWCEDAVRASGVAPADDGSVCRTEILEDDTSTLEVLGRHGFADAHVTGLYFSQELDRPLPSPSVPEGFAVRGMTDTDIERRAAVHFAAFSPGSRMTPEAYQAFMRAPGYDAALDSVVVAPDGRIAAYAMGWLDRENAVGEFEPVGCHPDFQRRGLARAALHRGLQMMKERSMTTAIVYTNVGNAAASALYPSAGFEQLSRFVTPSKGPDR